MIRSPLLRLALATGILSIVHAPPVQAQTPQVREWRRAHEHEILREYVDFLALPNVARNPDDIRRNAAHLMEMMRRRGLNPGEARRAEMRVPAGSGPRPSRADREPWRRGASGRHVQVAP